MAGALDGLKVLDFSWVVAAPLATKVLAEHGATVVRVESRKRLDVGRTYVLNANGVGVNNCAFFAAYNNDKYDITLNLGHAKARPIVERLVRWSDLVVENFRPGTMERWRLGYEELRNWNPSVIFIRASLFGQNGPQANQPGFGSMMQAQGGFTQLAGWHDRPPVGTPRAYTDYVTPWYMITAAIAALERREATGEGQCIDLSEMEAGAHFLAPALLDAAANDRVVLPAGNRVPWAAPHGVFPCLGDDRWCAISVSDDAQWRGLCAAMGEPAWTHDFRFATLLQRKENEDELEQRLEEWTRALEPEKVMDSLQEQGVPAGVVSNGKDIHEDCQLAHRGHLVWLEHSVMGLRSYDAPSFRLSRTPAVLRRAAPCLGEHTELVCRKFIGMSDEEFVALLSDGAFE